MENEAVDDLQMGRKSLKNMKNHIKSHEIHVEKYENSGFRLRLALWPAGRTIENSADVGGGNQLSGRLPPEIKAGTTSVK